MKILIESNCFQDVVGHIILQIGDAGYNILVKEASCSFNINPLFIAPEESSAVKGVNRQPELHDADVNDVVKGIKKDGCVAFRMNPTNSEGAVPDSSSPTKARKSLHGEGGIENLDAELVIGDDVVRCYWKGNANMENERVRVEVDEFSAIPINSNMLKDGERPVDSLVVCINSQSMTKTASFSQNGYSEEIIKVSSQLCTSKGNKKNEGPFLNVGDCSVLEGPLTKGPNGIALGEGEVQCQQASDMLVYPPGFEPRLSPSIASRVVSSSPPGFEGITKGKIRPAQRRSNSNNHISFIRRRETRSQSKKCKVMAGRSKKLLSSNGSGLGGKEGSPLNSETANTTESVRKIAEESLEIGELLGVKVVANKENAIKRITESLKKARVSQARKKKEPSE